MLSVEKIKKFDEPTLLIRINKLYKEGMSCVKLYESTRKHLYAVKIACSVYKGIVKEVYTIDKWFDSIGLNEGRKYFEDDIAPEEIRSKYLGKSVHGFLKKGASNPVMYV